MRTVIIIAGMIFTSGAALADTTVIICPQGQAFCTYVGKPGALSQTVRIMDCQGGQTQCRPVDKPVKCVTEDCRKWLLEKASEDIAGVIDSAYPPSAFGRTTVKACPAGQSSCTTMTLTGCPAQLNEKGMPAAIKELADGRAIECLVGQFRRLIDVVYRRR